MGELAVDGGTPVREQMLPYGRQTIDDRDVEAVVRALRSPWLTTGPEISRFEAAFAEFVGCRQAVATTSGTAALHCMMSALDLQSGDEVIVPPITFAASANSVIYAGGTPVFSDVDPSRLLLDPETVASRLTHKTRAILCVDYAGHPCDYDTLRSLAETEGLALLSDACHSLGGSYKGSTVGTLADMSVFSFHPVKGMTTGEGGMITTDSEELAVRLRRLRAHGITTDWKARAQGGSWEYDMVELGYCYRMTDIQAALGTAQLGRLREWVDRREELACLYAQELSRLPGIEPLPVSRDVVHGRHLQVVRLTPASFSRDRRAVFGALRAEGIGVNVHYIPVHLHPYYRDTYGTKPGLCPIAEEAYEQILTLPLFPQMAESDVRDVVAALQKVVTAWGMGEA